jgi:hypothetical protein
MDLYKTLNLIPVRSEPDVWVSRLMIFAQITPDSIIIRDILLSCGLNIVWAEEAEDDSTPAEITGHSAGKTTFCRLLRYVLGERTFGTKGAMELIRRAFPEGYVAAELHIRGRRWAVRRPFGSGRMSYIRGDASIEELLEQRGHSVTQELYSQEIGMEGLLDELETGAVVQTGESIQWAHILAWCTRDQEARFQNIHEWRSPRSEAESPSFRFPKAGPLFVMRAVLGLFLPDELKGEERLAELYREKERLAKAIEEKRQEPQFRVNLYDQQLRQYLKSLFPNESDIASRPFRTGELFPEDLEQLMARARKTIEEVIGDYEQERIALQIQIDDFGAEIRRHEEILSELEAFFSLDLAASRELDVGLSNRDGKRKGVEEVKDRQCPFGSVLIRECSYVQQRQRILQITELQDAREMKMAETRRIEESKRIEEGKERHRETIKKIREEYEKALEKRDVLTVQTREKREALSNLERVFDELVIWMQKRDRPGGYEEIDQLRRKIGAVDSEIIKIEKELTDLLQRHEDNRALIGSIFSGIVHSVLSSEHYDGKVSLDDRELNFRITHGHAMTGEAVETLSVLLADISCLFYSSVAPAAHLPGFLLHDSPREADLGIKIYRSFIRLVASLQEHFGSLDSCPFQYVITTTTPPPLELNADQFVKLRLNAGQTQGLLLRANIASPHQQNASLWE